MNKHYIVSKMHQLLTAKVSLICNINYLSLMSYWKLIKAQCKTQSLTKQRVKRKISKGSLRIGIIDLNHIPEDSILSVAFCWEETGSGDKRSR